MAHFFYCACGEEDAVITNDTSYTYSCKKCGNKEFINGYNAKKSDFYLTGKKLNVRYRCFQNEEGFRAVAYIDVPVDTNFIRKKILFETYDIAHYSISFKGEEQKSYILLKDEDIEKNLENKLRAYIIENYTDSPNISVLDKKWLDKKDKTEAILFFLAHPYLQNFEFYYWKINHSIPKLYSPKNNVTVKQILTYLLNGKTERSVRRALFNQYQQLQNKIRNLDRYFSLKPESYIFDPRMPFVICRSFEDPNIVSLLLSKQLFIPEREHEYYDPHFDIGTTFSLKELIWFIWFLKRHYSEKQIAKLLLSIDAYKQEWLDLIGLVQLYRRAISKEFRKVKLTVSHLHNEIIRCSENKENELIRHMKFTYSTKIKEACCKVNDLEFRLPYVGSELSKWALSLHNCMSGYAQYIETGRTVIYGLFKNNEIVYAVEVFNNEIRQCSGKYNNDVDIEDMATIEKWFQLFFDKFIRTN